MTPATILRADARNLPIADDSVDLCISSPPYWSLRSYQDNGCHYDGQIGAEATPGEFVDSLIEVTRECVRVLKPSGSLWVNLGDKYSGAGRGNHDSDKLNNTVEFREARSGTLNRRQHVGKGIIPAKSLMGIPWRYALACIDDLGLILRAEVIWSKPNGLPESVTDRVRRSHEQWFHFTLSPRYFSAVDELREQSSTAAHHERYAGRYGREDGRNGQSNICGVNPLGKLPGSVWTVPTEPLKVPAHLGVDHFAAFPTEWPKRIIQGWSPAGVCVECGEGRRPVGDKDRQPTQAVHNGRMTAQAGRGEGANWEGFSVPHRTTFTLTGYVCACTPTIVETIEERDERNGARIWRRAERPDLTWVNPAPTTPAVVLDPFGGTGTSAMVAKALGRHGISVDMSQDYSRLATWRTNDRNQLAKVVGIDKADPVHPDQLDLFGEPA